MKLLVKDLGGLAIYYPGQALVARAPRTWLDRAAAIGGDLVRTLGSEDIDQALEELALVFGDRPLPRPAQEILRDAWRLNMFNELEVLRYPYMNPSTIDEYCTIEGLEHLDAALERGKGAVILIGHYGANQMIMPALGHKGYPMNQLSAPPPVWADILRETRTTPLWEKVLARRWELEQRLPVQHINVFKFLRPAFECLHKNQVLGLAFDGGGGKRWCQVNLVERVANVSTQPIQLVRRTGAALLPTIVRRDPGQRRHRIVIAPALEYQKCDNREDEIQVNMQAFADVFGHWVALHPEQYLYFLLLRRRVRASDVMPYFNDYPALQGQRQMTAEEAQAHLKAAGERT
jgi:KDO2-lipid IV(A) lauroyltransferase